jgi:hypothetical protein
MGSIANLRLACATPSQNGHAKDPESAARVDRVDRVDRVAQKEMRGQAAEVARFLGAYIALPDRLLLLIGAWVVAAHLADLWDRFPHLFISSPEKECGKTRLLELLEMVCPGAEIFLSASKAAVISYCTVERSDEEKAATGQMATMILDEAQFLDRHGAEDLRDLLCGCFEQGSKSSKMGGKDWSVLKKHNVYGPKVLAKIGKLQDATLASRCLLVSMKRKTVKDKIARYRRRDVRPLGHALRQTLIDWTAKLRRTKKAIGIYNQLEQFALASSRLADVLEPLQTVLMAEGADGKAHLEELRLYAMGLEDQGAKLRRPPDKELLLRAFREMFADPAVLNDSQVACQSRDNPFLRSDQVLWLLLQREDEPWAHFGYRQEPITLTKVASLLAEYEIEPTFGKGSGGKRPKGYYRSQFRDAWARYLPQHAEEPAANTHHSPRNPINPINPANPANPASKPAGPAPEPGPGKGVGQ